jgi:hypothetical protein
VTARLPDRANSNALLIGAARFASDGIGDLPAVVNNVEALAGVLTDPTLGVIDPDRCLTVLDPRVQREIGTALDRTVTAATDTVIVYYAGHGLLTPRGVLHLAVADTQPDQAAYTAVPMEWLRAALADSPARNRILILDCCFSGHAAAAMTDIPSAVTSAIDISGTYTLTSAPATSTSIALPGARFTAFTGELIQVLREGVPGGSPLLSLRDIYLALIRRLQTRSMPRPQHLGTGLADLIALGPNAATHRPPTDPPRPETPTPHPAPQPDTATLEKQFHQELVQGYQRAKRELNYDATIYIRMISNVGGLAAARQLLHAPTVSSGFTTLWEKGRLDLAVEAFVLQDRFTSLFTDEERTIARDRLAEYGYHPTMREPSDNAPVRKRIPKLGLTTVWTCHVCGATNVKTGRETRVACSECGQEEGARPDTPSSLLTRRVDET